MLLEDDDLDAEEPCVRADELAEEALQRERARALSLLEGILAASGAEEAHSGSSRHKKAQAAAAAAAAAKTAELVDADADAAVELAGIELNERITLNAADGRTKPAPPDDAPPAQPPVPANASAAAAAAAVPNEISATESEQDSAFMRAAAGFANMGQLKNIFHREVRLLLLCDAHPPGRIAASHRCISLPLYQNWQLLHNLC